MPLGQGRHEAFICHALADEGRALGGRVGEAHIDLARGQRLELLAGPQALQFDADGRRLAQQPLDRLLQHADVDGAPHEAHCESPRAPRGLVTHPTLDALGLIQ